jgi:uncharacterized membrane protein YciS (DUF1049 family)
MHTLPRLRTPLQRYRRATRRGKSYCIIALLFAFIALNLFVLDTFRLFFEDVSSFDLYYLIIVGISIPLLALWCLEATFVVLNILVKVVFHALFFLRRKLLALRATKSWQRFNQRIEENLKSAKKDKSEIQKTEASAQNESVFDGVIERGPFAQRTIGGYILLLPIFLLWESLEFLVWFEGLVLLLSLVPILLISRHLLLSPIVKRTRSTGLNPWLALLLLVPPLNLPFLVFLYAAPAGAAKSLSASQ